MNEFNTWGKFWTYLIVAFMSSVTFGIMWGINVYTHWEPNVQQNTRLGLEANALNIEKMNNVYAYAKDLKSSGDLKYADSIIEVSKDSYRLVTLAEQKKDSVAELPPIAIIEIETKYINETSFRVYWTLDRKSKGKIKWGTESGNYPYRTVMEESFLKSHVQSIGTAANPPQLQSNTKYFYRIYIEDEYGNKRYSEEYNQTTK